MRQLLEAPITNVESLLRVAATSNPQLPQIVRLSSDLQSGKVKVDAQRAVDLQEGQFSNEAIAWGKHTIEITSGGVKTSVVFEAAPGRAPVLSEPPTAKEAKAVVVTSFGNQALIQATYSPVRVTVDNLDVGEVGPNGLDVPNLSVGNHDVVLAEGKDRYTMSLTVGAAPVLQVQLYSDRNVGSVLILTGEDDVRVEIDGKAQETKTKGGNLRITNLPVKPHTVRVFKDGFQEVAALPVEIKKGGEAKLQFALHPVPTVGALALHGAATGLQVLLDHKLVGTVGNDGSFSFSNIPPGNHTIELTDGHRRSSMARTFKAGETMLLGSADVVLSPVTGTLRLNVSPTNAAAFLRRSNEPETRIVGREQDLEEGDYFLRAEASGYVDFTRKVHITAGSSTPIEVRLTRAEPPNIPPADGKGGCLGYEPPSATSGP